MNLYAVRMLIVRLHKQGLGPMAIKDRTGVSWGAIRKAIDLHAAGGAAALKPKTRGCKKGTAKRLSDEQEKDIRNAIRDKRPEQLKMEFALWTREAVMKYIEEHHGIRLPIRTVGEYLKRWGYTPQKPVRVAYEQKPEAVKEWLVTTCTVWGARQRFSMISSVNNQGKCYWMVIDGVFNADRLVESMESLIKDVPRKVFLVMDNLKVHHCKPVMAWLEEHKDRIEVFYLPSYSPELNPDERLNADLKHAITTSVPKRTRQGLRKKTEEHMTMVASTPERVKSYFKDKHVRYAADSQ